VSFYVSTATFCLLRCEEWDRVVGLPRHKFVTGATLLQQMSCVPNVASFSGLSSSCVLRAQCCQFLWIVFLLCLACPMLPVSLDCIPPVSCVPNVASFSGLSIPDCPFGLLNRLFKTHICVYIYIIEQPRYLV
jgi:hypothetical protein